MADKNVFLFLEVSLLVRFRYLIPHRAVAPAHDAGWFLYKRKGRKTIRKRIKWKQGFVNMEGKMG